ncbi:MAG: metal-dependent transcriptional regulator [Peptococcaceae bacterium]|nr:metal-dependent transcriptional regulator [Peptococcaceae bacterium]
MLSPSLEDYLEELYRFSLTTPTVRVTDLSTKLHVKLPSVTKALHRLKDLNYIKYEPYGEIELTEMGRDKGTFLVKRNKLLLEFLTLICSDCNVEAEAEAMEHYLCAATIAAIDNLVAFARSRPEWYGQFLQYLGQTSESELTPPKA